MELCKKLPSCGLQWWLSALFTLSRFKNTGDGVLKHTVKNIYTYIFCSTWFLPRYCSLRIAPISTLPWWELNLQTQSQETLRIAVSLTYSTYQHVKYIRPHVLLRLWPYVFSVVFNQLKCKMLRSWISFLFFLLFIYFFFFANMNLKLPIRFILYSCLMSKQCFFPINNFSICLFNSTDQTVNLLRNL